MFKSQSDVSDGNENAVVHTTGTYYDGTCFRNTTQGAECFKNV